MKYLSQEKFTHSIQIKKSDFITNVFPIESAEEAESIIAKMKRDFPDATHHCSAYLLNKETLVKKAYDDGEPSKTAGLPILKSIEYSQFENILVIVTRYFGGIKLGAGGLIRAYSQASREALSLAPYHVPKLYHKVKICGNIQHLGNFNNTLYSQFQLSQIETTFEADQFVFSCLVDDTEFIKFQVVVQNQFHFFDFEQLAELYI